MEVGRCHRAVPIEPAQLPALGAIERPGLALGVIGAASPWRCHRAVRIEPAQLLTPRGASSGRIAEGRRWRWAGAIEPVRIERIEPHQLPALGVIGAASPRAGGGDGADGIEPRAWRSPRVASGGAPVASRSASSERIEPHQLPALGVIGAASPRAGGGDGADGIEPRAWRSPEGRRWRWSRWHRAVRIEPAQLLALGACGRDPDSAPGSGRHPDCERPERHRAQLLALGAIERPGLALAGGGGPVSSPPSAPSSR